MQEFFNQAFSILTQATHHNIHLSRDCFFLLLNNEDQVNIMIGDFDVIKENTTLDQQELFESNLYQWLGMLIEMEQHF